MFNDTYLTKYGKCSYDDTQIGQSKATFVANYEKWPNPTHVQF